MLLPQGNVKRHIKKTHCNRPATQSRQPMPYCVSAIPIGTANLKLAADLAVLAQVGGHRNSLIHSASVPIYLLAFSPFSAGFGRLAQQLSVDLHLGLPGGTEGPGVGVEVLRVKTCHISAQNCREIYL